MNNSFEETSFIIGKLLIDIKSGRAEVIAREAVCDYGKFYRDKEFPESGSEGEISVIGWNGKGVPVANKEAAKLIVRKGKKRQNKKVRKK